VVKQLPNVALDGEIWTQYGLYQDATSLCIKGADPEKWNRAIYWVFDAPSLNSKSYEERINYLKELPNLPKFVKVVESIKCEGKETPKAIF